MNWITQLYFLLLIHAQLLANAQQFPELAKAYWIERLAFFRVNALLYAASDMRCVSWSTSLEAQAGNIAHNCSQPTSSQVNFILVEQHDDPSEYVDAAIKGWVVDKLLEIKKTIPHPKQKAGFGTGFYSSYSLIVWATTNQVGCGYGSCGDKTAVVCLYNGAPNTAKSPWYTHGAQASACPSGTSSVGGLCSIDKQRCAKNAEKIPLEKVSGIYYKGLLQSIQDQDNGKGPPVNVNAPSPPIIPTPVLSSARTGKDENPPEKKADLENEKKENSSPPKSVDLTKEEQPESTNKSLGSKPDETESQPNKLEQRDSEKNSQEAGSPVQTVQNQAIFTKKNGSFSPVAITGLVAVGCLVVVVAAVLLRYKQSQKRQQEIVRDAALDPL